jgi:hypothetical protein
MICFYNWEELLRNIANEGWSVVMHICNSSYLRGRGRGLAIQGQQAYLRNILKPKGLGMWIKW